MASKAFKQLFLLRFIAYFSIITGGLVLAFALGPVSLAEVSYRSDKILGVTHTVAPLITTSQGQSEVLESTPDPGPEVPQSSDSPKTPAPTPVKNEGGGFGSLGKSNENIITPVSTDYGIVIEKINANAKVIPDVDPGNEKSYQDALAKGVAATKGSTEPGKPGNVYIFSHSVDAPWNVIRYNAVFYLLREMEVGDRIIIYYQGKRYDYIVFDKTITDPSDLSFLSNRYDKPVITLQTCDPPGTLLHRLIVRAKLQSS